MHNRPTPKFSIITVTYNAEAVLEDTVMMLNLGVGRLCMSSGYFVINVDVSLGNGTFRIIRNGFPAGLLGEGSIRARSVSSRCRWQNPRLICIVPRSRCADGLSSPVCRLR